MIRTVGGVGVAVALLATQAKCQPSGGSPPPQPGHAYACDTRASAPRFDTARYGYPAVLGHTNSVCDVPPKRHTVFITLWYYDAGGHWSAQLDGDGVAGCPTGTDNPKDPTPGDCYRGVHCKTGRWKITVYVKGIGPGPNYEPFEWNLPADEQQVAAIVCPIPKQRKG